MPATPGPLASRLTVNAGLAWSYEPNALNHDLTKPALLAPILGADGLHAPPVRTHNFSPTLGFAWTATRDGKTVVRGGAGRYFDPAGSTNALNLANERHALSPLGTGRLTVRRDSLVWNGRLFDFRQPTAFTGAQLLEILPGIRADLEASIDPDNRDFTYRNIDRTKQGTNLYDPDYATPYAIHVNLGVQRELANGVVVSGDVVWKHFVHTFINGIDYNRWNSVGGPVIPACVGAAAGRPRRDLLDRQHVLRHDHRPRALHGAAGSRREAPVGASPVPGLLRARQLRRQQRHRHRHDGSTRAGVCSGSTTTTGSRTTGPCRPTCATC